MGWNQLEKKREYSLLAGIDAGAYFYSRILTPRSIRMVRPPPRAATARNLSPSSNRRYPFRAVSSRKKRRRRCAPAAKFSEARGMSIAHRIIPCLDTDGERGRHGSQLYRPARRRRPSRARRALQRRRRRRTGGARYCCFPRSPPDFPRNHPPRRRGIGHSSHAGGGIRTLEDGRAVVRAGADKVTVNTAAGRAPRS